MNGITLGPPRTHGRRLPDARGSSESPIGLYHITIPEASTQERTAAGYFPFILTLTLLWQLIVVNQPVSIHDTAARRSSTLCMTSRRSIFLRLALRRMPRKMCDM